MDETCVQRGMPTASGAVVGPTVFHIVYLLGLAANYLGSLFLIPVHILSQETPPDCVAVCEMSKKEKTKNSNTCAEEAKFPAHYN